MLSIGGTSGGPISILTLAVCKLQEMTSEIDVRVVEETWSSALLAQLEDRSLDVAICHEPEESELIDKVALPIFQARRYLCVRAGHPEAAKLSLNVLAQYRSEEHTSELQSLMRISYDVFCLKKKN